MDGWTVRPALPGDVRLMAELYAAVAGERTGIAGEPPVDVEELSSRFARELDGSLVAVADGRLIGLVSIEASRHGFGEIGMLVERGSRGRGVGGELLAGAVAWARDRGLHKLCLEVFAHNDAAIGLYRKCGFTEEGRRVRQYRRASGEYWDSIIMGRAI